MYMYTRVCPECIYIVYIDTITKSMSLQNNLKNSYPYKITLKFSWLIKLVLILVIVFTPLVWLLCFTLGCSEPAFPAPQVVRPLPLWRSIVLPHLRMGNSADTVAVSKTSCCSHQIAMRYMQGNQLFLIFYLYRCFAMRIKIRRYDSQQLYDCIIIFLIREQNCTRGKHIPCW